MIAEAVLCLALNVFYEARGEPIEGRMAVALVTRNRAQQNATSICWEVFRDSQFSWTNDVRNLRRLPQGEKWQQAQDVARVVLEGLPDFTNGATHFHVVGLKPRWSRSMVRVGIWGTHVFYIERAAQVVSARR